jgi:hypothetical protein
MPRRLVRFALIALLATGGAYVLAHAWLGERATYRYRLTIEVDTPDGLRTGSSVIETTTVDGTSSWGPPESRLVRSYTRGEAVFVDLGRGRNLIALLARGDTGEERGDLHWLVPGVFSKNPIRDRSVAKLPGIYTVPTHLTPTLMSFEDAADPRSGRMVPRSDLSRVLGPGYTFRQATVEIVPTGFWPVSALGLSGEPITRSIASRLPWLDRLEQYRTDPTNPFTNTLPRYVGLLRRGF